MTSCDSPAGIGASLRTHGLTNGWKHRRDVGNSIFRLARMRIRFLLLEKLINVTPTVTKRNFTIGDTYSII